MLLLATMWLPVRRRIFERGTTSSRAPTTTRGAGAAAGAGADAATGAAAGAGAGAGAATGAAAGAAAGAGAGAAAGAVERVNPCASM